MFEPQGPMSGPDFVEMMRNDTTEKPSVESWSTAAAGVVMVVASNPEKFDIDIIVESIQTLAQQIPFELLMRGAMHIDHTAAALRGN